MDNFDLAEAMANVASLEGLQEPPTENGAAGDSVMIRDLPAHQYHADRDALSCSLLKPLLVSPAHFKAGLTECPKSSDARDFGTLLHLLLLQPTQVGSEVAVYPGVVNARTKEYKEFEARHPDKLVVDEPTFASARRLAEKVAATRYKGRPLQLFIEESICEPSIYFTEPTTGLRLRIRPDAYHPDLTFDLKSTRFAALRAFTRDAIERDYDMQAFMYSFGRCMYEGTEKAKPFVFITAETSAPHSVSTLTAGERFLNNGAAKFQACVAAFKACSQTGYWPDLGTDAELDIEPWQQFSPSAGWRAALQ